MIPPAYALVTCKMADVRHLFEEHHGYKSAGKVAVYCFAVTENDRPVAAFVWQPPPPGSAKSVNPHAPAGVLALSRMVAVPRSERNLNHISKPLRRQMRMLIDRTRYPSLVTYSDEGQGHTGHVYKCSGWTRTSRRSVRTYETTDGVRVSRYSDGGSRQGLNHLRKGRTFIQRWEHHIVPVQDSALHMTSAGWCRQAIPGKVWRSGAQAYKWIKAVSPQQDPS